MAHHNKTGSLGEGLAAGYLTAKGFVPDIEVLPSSFAIKNGIDLKINIVKVLIEEKKH